MSETPKIRCPKCGAWVPANYLICPYCGAQLYERPQLVAESRSLRERIKSVISAVKTGNFEFLLELLLVPVPGAYVFALLFTAMALAHPVLASPYGLIAFAAFVSFRFIFLIIFLEIYVRIITVRRVKDHDVRMEVVGLGSLWLMITAPFLYLAGVSSLNAILAYVAFLFTLAALVRYYKLGKTREYGLIPILAFLALVGFLAIRIFSLASCAPWRWKNSYASTLY